MTSFQTKLREILREYKKKPMTYLVSEEDDALSAILDLVRKELPEMTGMLSAEDFNHLEEFQYALMQERNIGFNQAIDTIKKRLG